MLSIKRPRPSFSSEKGPNSFSRQQGVSLIEVLVAVFVFSLGLVGMLSMSVAALENNKAAQLRMTGVGLVNDYAERVRMNIRGFDSNAYAIALGDSAGTTVSTNPNEANNPVAAATVAQADIQSLLTEVAQRLPQGDAVVQLQATAGSSQRSLHLWLLWVEPTASAGSVAASLFVQGQQNCPGNLSATDAARFNCMYFMVPL